MDGPFIRKLNNSLSLYLISAGHSLTTFELTITRLASKVRKIVKEKIRDEDDEDSDDDSDDSEGEVTK